MRPVPSLLRGEFARQSRRSRRAARCRLDCGRTREGFRNARHGCSSSVSTLRLPADLDRRADVASARRSESRTGIAAILSSPHPDGLAARCGCRPRLRIAGGVVVHGGATGRLPVRRPDEHAVRGTAALSSDTADAVPPAIAATARHRHRCGLRQPRPSALPLPALLRHPRRERRPVAGPDSECTIPCAPTAMKLGDWSGNRPKPLREWSLASWRGSPLLRADLGRGMADRWPSTCRRQSRSRPASGCRTTGCGSTAPSTSRAASRAGCSSAAASRSSRPSSAEASTPTSRCSRGVPSTSRRSSSPARGGIHQRPGALERMESQASTDLWGLHLLDGAGHWVQQERSSDVTRLVLDFLSALSRRVRAPERLRRRAATRELRASTGSQPDRRVDARPSVHPARARHLDVLQ